MFKKETTIGTALSAEEQRKNFREYLKTTDTFSGSFLRLQDAWAAFKDSLKRLINHNNPWEV